MEEKLLNKEWIDNDYIYLSSGKEFLIKENYKEVRKIIENQFPDNKDIEVLDVGTSSGELPYYLLNSLNLKNKLYAIDNSETLIQNAKDRFGDSNIEFIIDDAQTFDLDKKFDVIILCGVISIFNDYKPCIDRLLYHLKDTGIIIIMSLLNDYDIEVNIKFKTEKLDQWQSGYNIFPLNHIKDYIIKKGYDIKSTSYVLPFDLQETDDPIRAWTIMCDGKRMFRNGLCLIYDLKFVVIGKNI